MTPLSSINAYVNPKGMIQFLPQATGTDPSASSVASPAALLQQTIPASELQQLSQIPTAPEITPVAQAPVTAGGSASSFTDMLGKAVQEVNNKQANAQSAIEGLISGQNVSLHQAMISMQEANVSFQLMVEVRNKLLDSYQELMRMQV
jgi:flagellar hook-basal body complex protein FliE